MRSDRKRTILFIIILLVMSMGIGYAFLTTTLSIDGVSDIDSAVWDIHFENIEEGYDSITAVSPATIGADETSISFNVKLEKPDDYYAFKVKAVNDGTLNAIIEDISFKINDVENGFPPYLMGGLLYWPDDSSINVGDYLVAGTYSTYFFSLYYDADVSLENLPTANTSLSVSIEITFSQAPPFDFFYTNNEIPIVAGQRLVGGVPMYSNYRFNTNSDDDAFLKIQLDNKYVSEISAGLIYDNQVYYLKGLGATFNSTTVDYNNDSPYFDENVNTLLGIFNSEDCLYKDSGNTFECKVYYNYREHIFNVKKNGFIYILTPGHYVLIDQSGRAISEVYTEI